jgi:hypothetical protein
VVAEVLGPGRVLRDRIGRLFWHDDIDRTVNGAVDRAGQPGTRFNHTERERERRGVHRDVVSGDRDRLREQADRL